MTTVQFWPQSPAASLPKRLTDCQKHVRRAEWFLNEAGNFQAGGLKRHFRNAEAAHEDDRQIRSQAPQFPGGFEPAHLRHRQIENDGVDLVLMLVIYSNAFLPISGHQHGQASSFEDVSQYVAN